MSTAETENRLTVIRRMATHARNGHAVSILALANEFLTLDAHLSAGGTPPEEWREGPDAPADSGPWGWQGDPVADDLDRGDVPAERPVPEGLAVFAHWSKVHDGINVEMDVPDGLRVTVHYNDALMVDHQVSEDGLVAFDRMPKLDADGSHNVMCVCDQCTEDDDR